MKKVLSIILISTMVLSTISTTFAVEYTPETDILQEIHTETLTSASCGENAYWSFDESTGTVTISGTGAMTDYTGWSFLMNYRSDIKTAVISEGITSIGGYGFYQCYNLTSVTIPDSVTNIGKGAFYFCSSLTSITLPESLTSIESYTFSNCSSLTSLSIPKSVTFIDFAIFSTFPSSIPLSTVNYGGTEGLRTAIDISSGNDPLETAEWIYSYQDPSWTEIKSEEDTTPATPLPVATHYSSYLTNISGNAITSGSLPSGLGMLSNGTLGGIPTQQGDFDFYIGDSRYSLHIQENTPENVESDNDFEIIERVPTITDNFEEYVFEVSGEFPNFMNFYLDGRLLVRDVDYYAEEGSTRITLYAWSIGQLPIGIHTINATFTYGSGNNIEVQKVSQSFSKTSNAAAPSEYADYVSPTISGNSANY